MRTRHAWMPCLVLVLLLPLAGCGSSSGSGGGGGPPPPAIFVDAINAPLFADLATTFVVEGAGFGAPGDIVLVRFEVLLGQGTPFANGTSDTAIVEAVVQNDNQCIGLSPPALSPGSFTAYVDVLIGPAEGLSADPIASFIRAPAIPNVEYFPLIGPDASTDAVIVGGSGSDVLIGTADPDTLIGNAGNDYLDGLDDDDSYEGGADLDAFAVDFLPGTTTEFFEDFTPADDLMITFGDPGDVSFSVLGPITTVIDDGLDVTIGLAGGGAIVMFDLGDSSIVDLAELLFAGVKLVVSLP